MDDVRGNAGFWLLLLTLCAVPSAVMVAVRWNRGQTNGATQVVAEFVTSWLLLTAFVVTAGLVLPHLEQDDAPSDYPNCTAADDCPEVEPDLPR